MGAYLTAARERASSKPGSTARALGPTAAITPPSAALKALGPGQPLPAHAAERFESAHRVNLGEVRLHAANQVPAILGARAITVGHHIAVAPGVEMGDAIDHELANVAQQRGGTGGSGATNTELEREADAVASGSLTALSPTASRVQAQEGEAATSSEGASYSRTELLDAVTLELDGRNSALRRYVERSLADPEGNPVFHEAIDRRVSDLERYVEAQLAYSVGPPTDDVWVVFRSLRDAYAAGVVDEVQQGVADATTHLDGLEASNDAFGDDLVRDADAALTKLKNDLADQTVERMKSEGLELSELNALHDAEINAAVESGLGRAYGVFAEQLTWSAYNAGVLIEPLPVFYEALLRHFAGRLDKQDEGLVAKLADVGAYHWRTGDRAPTSVEIAQWDRDLALASQTGGLFQTLLPVTSGLYRKDIAGSIADPLVRSATGTGWKATTGTAIIGTRLVAAASALQGLNYLLTPLLYGVGAASLPALGRPAMTELGLLGSSVRMGGQALWQWALRNPEFALGLAEVGFGFAETTNLDPQKMEKVLTNPAALAMLGAEVLIHHELSMMPTRSGGPTGTPTKPKTPKKPWNAMIDVRVGMRKHKPKLSTQPELPYDPAKKPTQTAVPAARKTADPDPDLFFPNLTQTELGDAWKGVTRGNVQLKSGGRDIFMSTELMEAAGYPTWMTKSRKIPLVKGGKPYKIRLSVEDVPRREGEDLAAVKARLETVIGTKLTGHPALEKAWNDKIASMRSNPSFELTQPNHPQKYKQAQEGFWKNVRADPEARAIFEDAGFELTGGVKTAAKLAGTEEVYRPIHDQATGLVTMKKFELPRGERTVSLDHVLEKGQGDNWRYALDADNLELTFTNPNAHRETIQKRHKLREDMPESIGEPP